MSQHICLWLVAALLVGVSLSGLVRAEDWTTTDGKTYSEVTVIKSDSESVTILDKDGGARIPLFKLPPDLQKRFSYNPSALNSSPVLNNDTTPLRERTAWANRLSEFAAILLGMKKEGGSFVAGGTTHAWNDITEITPTTLSFMTDKGIGKIAFEDLPPEVAKQLTLSSEEVEKWNADEAQRLQTIKQIALDSVVTRLKA